MDLDGKKVYYFFDPNTFKNYKYMQSEIESDIKELEEIYGTNVVKCPLTNETSFESYWNQMDDTDTPIDAVIIYSHAGPNKITTGSHWEKHLLLKNKFCQDATINREFINDLPAKNINTLILMGCNTALTEQDNGNDGNLKKNLATTFVQKEGIKCVIAADGSIWHKYEYSHHHMEVRASEKYHPDGVCDGMKIYRYDDADNPKCIGYVFDGIKSLISSEKD